MGGKTPILAVGIARSIVGTEGGIAIADLNHDRRIWWDQLTKRRIGNTEGFHSQRDLPEIRIGMRSDRDYAKMPGIEKVEP